MGRYLGKKGTVSIAELLVSLALAAIVLGAVYPLLFSGTQTEKRVSVNWDIQTESQKALDQMVDELRAAVEVVAVTPPPNLREDEVHFRKSPTGPKIIYKYESGTLTREENSSTETLLEKITSFQLTYYASDGSAATTPAEVAAVEISLKVKSSSEPGGTIDLISRAKLRLPTP